MRNNIITAVAGDKPYVKTDQVFQYDYGLMLVIDGITLPEEYEVHFCNTNSKAAKIVTGDAHGVQIPDEYLRNGEDVHAWLYLHTVDKEEDGESVYHFHIPVIERAAINKEEITPVEHDVIDEALLALADAVEKTAANVSHYPYVADDGYWMVWDAVNEEFVSTGYKAQGDNMYNLSIGTVTTLAPGASATASVDWVDGNAYLNLGIPVGDTSSMVSIHDEQTDQNPVHITDGADNIAVDDIRINITPAQEGNGTAGPRNIRRISGWTELNLYHTGANVDDHYQISFENEAGTVYGGMFYPLTGRLAVDRVLISKRCTDMNNVEVQPGWRDSGIRAIIGAGISQMFTGETLNIGTSYGVDTTGDNDLLYLGYDQYGMRQSDWKNTEITVQICVRLPEPVEYQYTPIALETVYGENTFSADTGSIAYIKYPCDTKKYVDRKIAETQALVLEN